MARTPMWRRYVRFWGSDVRADVDAELDFHVRELTERLVRQGRDPVAARAEAERRFGDYARVRTACVDIDRGWERQRRWRQLAADLWRDLRIGARTLAKNPGFTVSAVVVLGLGLGAATVMVSVINAVFVRPLPFPDPDRIVSVVRYRPSGPTSAHSQAAVAHSREHSRAFSALAGIGPSPGANLASDGGSAYVRNLEVTAGFFRVFGVEPQMGRAFVLDDEADPSTVVLSHAVWAGHFGGDPDIVGQDVRLGGRPHTVIGIMPADFWSYEQAEAWTPFRPDPRGIDMNYRLIGRLAPGWTAAQAAAELQALAVSLRDQLPVPAAPDGAAREDPRHGVQPYRDWLATASEDLIWLLTAAIGAMLLIVCSNAAGLQLARAVRRRRELAVRSALGAGRGRLLRQLLTENALLSTAGWAVGLLAASAGVRGLASTQPLLAIWGIAVDAPVLLASLGIALATSLLFGLLPGLLAVRDRPADTLHGGRSRSVTPVRGSWLRRSLVVTQVALCTVLLATVGGFLRTFVEMSSSELGFEPANVLTARASLQGPDYRSTAAVSALYRRTLADLERVPGVEAAAVASNLPVERGLNLPLREAPGGPIVAEIDWRYVTGDYLRVLRIPLVAGRAFSETDHRAAGPPVALVNEEYARRLEAAGRAVIGSQLQMTVIEFDDQVREVVGVLGDVRTRGVTASRPTVFVPVEQVPDELLALAHEFIPVNWALRARDDPAGLIRSVERIVREADPLLSITAFRSMDEVVGGAIASTRFRTFALGLFAAMALALAAAGLYGLVAYAVVQQTKEIGIRLALGASSGRVTARFAREGLVLAVVGGALGGGAALLVTELLRRLTDAQPLDPWTVAGALLVLGTVSAAATVVPARRAARVDPMLTLRAE